MSGPSRIVCLTEETTETLYRLGEEERIVGISAFTVRPPQARRDKPVVSQYIRADVEAIVALRPDLVLGFSDLQADICAELIRRGMAVHCFNQRSVEDILGMVAMLGGMIGRPEKAEALCSELRANLDRAARQAAELPFRPRVFFEEWPEPVITGIRWVSELVEIAGGVDCFAELREQGLAKDRVVSPEQVLERRPDLYIASWCGRKFSRKVAAARPGFANADFMRDGRVVALDSSIILQPGPAALSDGLAALREHICRVAGERAS